MEGRVEVGAGAFLSRLRGKTPHNLSSASSSSDAAATEIDAALRFPEPLLSECVAEMRGIVSSSSSSSSSKMSGEGDARPALAPPVALQTLCLRFFATLLHG